MATSAYAYFGVMTAMTEGKPIPHDIAWDNEGRPALNPADALKGALRSFDRSYKVDYHMDPQTTFKSVL